MQQVVAQKGSCLDLDRDLELALLSEDAGDLLRLLLLCLPFSFTASDDCLGLIGSAFVCMPNMLLMMYSHVILPYCTSPQIHYHTIQYYKHCMRNAQGNFHARHACHVVRFAGLFDAMLPKMQDFCRLLRQSNTNINLALQTSVYTRQAQLHQHLLRHAC